MVSSVLLGLALLVAYFACRKLNKSGSFVTFVVFGLILLYCVLLASLNILDPKAGDAILFGVNTGDSQNSVFATLLIFAFVICYSINKFIEKYENEEEVSDKEFAKQIKSVLDKSDKFRNS